MKFERSVLIAMFMRLRQSRFDLGVRELLDAVKLAEGDGICADVDALRDALQMLWCKSPQALAQFENIWKALVTESAESQPTPERRTAPPAQTNAEPRTADEFLPPSVAQPQTMPPVTTPEWTALPVYAPFTPTAANRRFELLTYWPLSRRSMAYAWRYLRRPIADGPPDVLDVDATVESVAQQGFYLSPIYRRRKRNHAHLLLLVDQNGSMMPMHRFSRDLIETALETMQPEKITMAQAEVFYFQNVPGEYLYRDPHLTLPVERAEVFGWCGSDTSVLIVSDAGAARGQRKLPRIQATTEALFHLKQHTSLIAWLNPLPQERWSGSSAQIIAHLIPMYQMDGDGFNKAIDVVRGQPWHR